MARKYIDADRLNAEIERYIKDVKDVGKRLTPNMGFFDAKLSGIYDVMSIVASLQQEQPVEGLEEELKRYLNSDEYINTPENGTLLIARHFAEWGAEQKAIELFRKQNCKNCGSQRCTGDGEWLEGCEKFREWKDKT